MNISTGGPDYGGEGFRPPEPDMAASLYEELVALTHAEDLSPQDVALRAMSLAADAHKALVETARDRDRLVAEAETDLKMGIGSHRALVAHEERLNESIIRSRTDEQRQALLQFTYVYFDFDGFSTINEIVGHPTVDRLFLPVLGRHIRLALRPTDLAFRTGGDEKVAIIYGVSAIEEEDKAEIRERIDRAGRAAFEEFLALLSEEGMEDKANLLATSRLYGYSVGVQHYNPSLHRTVKDVEEHANEHMRWIKGQRKEAVGMRRDQKNSLPGAA